jgi:hypothetical protein
LVSFGFDCEFLFRSARRVGDLIAVVLRAVLTLVPVCSVVLGVILPIGAVVVVLRTVLTSGTISIVLRTVLTSGTISVVLRAVLTLIIRRRRIARKTVVAALKLLYLFADFVLNRFYSDDSIDSVLIGVLNILVS